MLRTNGRPAEAGARPGAPRRRPVPLLVGTALALALHVWGLYRSPPPAGVALFPGVDKVQHVVGFAVPLALVLLCVSAYVAGPARRRWQVLAVAGFAAHAPVSELLQRALLPTRTADPLDAVADLLGVTVGAALGLAGSRWVGRG